MIWYNAIGLSSNICSFLILLYQLYDAVKKDCQANPHALTEIQKQDILHERITDIHTILHTIKNCRCRHTNGADTTS
jgi:hypothetical protein